VKSIQNLERSYATATEQARNQYIIGYVSNNEVFGSGPLFRTIRVVADEGRLKTLHRRGYYAFP
jgi:hypothetical protein